MHEVVAVISSVELVGFLVALAMMLRSPGGGLTKVHVAFMIWTRGAVVKRGMAFFYV
jgi:hypothetical protein